MFPPIRLWNNILPCACHCGGTINKRDLECDLKHHEHGGLILKSWRVEKREISCFIIQSASCFDFICWTILLWVLWIEEN